jgi:hypothetical protein
LRTVKARKFLFLIALCLAGCESDEHKAERLRTDMTLSCISAKRDGTLNSQNECDVATRKYNKFMSGR